jgi:hypothetical protein
MDIYEVVKTFQPISLKEMDAVGLLNRVDTKYILSSKILPEILLKVNPNYRILEIKNERIFDYSSLYFDTAENNMYLDHHNGKLNRYKVRFRRYVSSNLIKLEIKFKSKGIRTIKKQALSQGIETSLSDTSREFIEHNSPFHSDELVPAIYTNFSRITLVNNNMTERATIDINLKFIEKDVEKDAGYLALIEVKRGSGTGMSELMQTLKNYGIRRKGFSKYCVGRALMEPELKKNKFKEKLLIIKKLNNDSYSDNIA